MAAEIQRADYYYVTVPDKPGKAARILSALSQAGVNLVAFSGFPIGGRKSQLDFVPENSADFLRAARKAGLKLSKRKTGFLIQAKDRRGAVAATLSKLAEAKLNVTSVQAICSGAGRFGGLLWVKSRDLKKAAKLLGA